MKALLMGLGGVVFAAGVFLWCGNVFQFCPTFPFVGYVTALIGAGIYGAGKKMD